MKPLEERLPPSILNKAVKKANTFFGRISDIPELIEAARQAEIISLGGALNFIGLPGTSSEDVGTCECYWVKALVAPSEGQEWATMVEDAALSTRKAFLELPQKYDFHKEGLSFPTVKGYADRGGNLDDIMYFYWTMDSEEEYRERRRRYPSHPTHPEKKSSPTVPRSKANE